MVKRLNAEFTLTDCLFGAVKLTKNTNPNKSSYSGYGIGFDSPSLFSIPNFDWGKNVIIFGLDMSSSVRANNKNKDLLILDKGQEKKGLNNTLRQQKQNFQDQKQCFVLNLHYNESNIFYLLMPQKYISLKQKILK